LRDIEQLAERIGDMTAMLQNFTNRENISKGMLSRINQLAM
jgi:C4-dicarboxylate-specific signal transduction histidine kinase